MNKIFEKIKSFYKSNSEVITPTAVLAVICIVVTLALSSANLLTYKKIDALAKETQEKAMASFVCDQKNEPIRENKRLKRGPDIHKSHSSP